LHGDGVQIATNNFWTRSIPLQDLAWVVYPTGRTSWSIKLIQGIRGFDWHGPSFQNIDASIEAVSISPGIPNNLKQHHLSNPERLMFVGHSNGGHGAWWCACHYPDRVLAGKTIPTKSYQPLDI
jgi:poly(3-hydroxybutyrate) depolymerase